VISIVVCCHSVKLRALAARAFRSQQPHFTAIQYPPLVDPCQLSSQNNADKYRTATRFVNLLFRKGNDVKTQHSVSQSVKNKRFLVGPLKKT